MTRAGRTTGNVEVMQKNNFRFFNNRIPKEPEVMRLTSDNCMIWTVPDEEIQPPPAVWPSSIKPEKVEDNTECMKWTVPDEEPLPAPIWPNVVPKPTEVEQQTFDFVEKKSCENHGQTLTAQMAESKQQASNAIRTSPVEKRSSTRMRLPPPSLHGMRSRSPVTEDVNRTPPNQHQTASLPKSNHKHATTKPPTKVYDYSSKWYNVPTALNVAILKKCDASSKIAFSKVSQADRDLIHRYVPLFPETAECVVEKDIYTMCRNLFSEKLNFRVRWSASRNRYIIFAPKDSRVLPTMSDPKDEIIPPKADRYLPKKSAFEACVTKEGDYHIIGMGSTCDFRYKNKSK